MLRKQKLDQRQPGHMMFVAEQFLEGAAGGSGTNEPSREQQIADSIHNALISDEEYVVPEIKADQQNIDDDPANQQQQQNNQQQNNQQQNNQQQQQQQQNQEGAYVPNPIWNKVKTDFETEHGEGTFEFPEGISQENEADMFMQFMQQSYIGDPELIISRIPNPELQDIVRRSLTEENFDFNSALESKKETQNILGMPHADFLKWHLQTTQGYDETKNPDGFTDQDIDDYIGKLNKVEIAEKAQGLKAVVKTQLDAQAAEKNVAKTKQQQTFIDTQIAKRTEGVNSLIERNKTRNSFLGIEFSEAEKTQFLKDLPTILNLNPKTKSYPLEDMMRSDDFLMEVAALAWKGTKGLRDNIDTIRENGIQSVWEKIRKHPESENGGTRNALGFNPPSSADLV